jgi:oligopeptide/dipeptide ABC transporter ATP-binding protein
MDDIISIRNLKTSLLSTKGIVHAVQGINLDIAKGEVHGVVGESGCGKTMMAKSLLRLHNERRTEYAGEIIFNNEVDILKLNKKELQQLRGRYISMVFQDPMVSLNPLYTVGEQISEMLRVHLHLKKKEAYDYTLNLLYKMGIYPPEKRYNQYPFEFSGGMLQRIMIAIAVSCNPKLLIADEPTTALDVTIQANILELFKELRQSTGMAILFITHNFGVVAEICDRVSVMYAGKIVETGKVSDIFRNPEHPYTRALIQSIPRSSQRKTRLATIPGSPPELYRKIEGCSYVPRCEFASDNCFMESPRLLETQKGHLCLLYQ